MNQIICLFLTLCVLLSTFAQAEELKGPVKKTIDAADQAAIKGVDKLDKLSHGVEVRVEKLVHPPPHQSGQKNIVKSALGGFGRLLRDVSVEGTKFAGTVGVGALKFSKGSAKAVQQTLKDSAKRIVKPRRKPAPQPAEIVVIEPTAVPVAPAQPVVSNESAPAEASADAQAPAPAPAPAAVPVHAQAETQVASAVTPEASAPEPANAATAEVTPAPAPAPASA